MKRNTLRQDYIHQVEILVEAMEALVVIVSQGQLSPCMPALSSMSYQAHSSRHVPASVSEDQRRGEALEAPQA